MRSVSAWLAALILASGLLLAGAAAPETERVALTLEAGSTVVQAGQEAQFLLALEEGADINVIKGTLEYDQEIFELPSQEDFEPLGGWESVFYNPDSGQFILFHRGAQPEPGDVLSIRLAAKGELTAGSARVGVTGLAVSGGDFVKILRVHAGVTVTPGTEFGPQFTSSFRINFSQDRRAALAAVDRITTMIERYRL